MKTNPNHPIVPMPRGGDGSIYTHTDMEHLEGMGALIGLSKREYFASQAMIGLIANAPNGNLHNSKEGTQLCRQWADDLIQALNFGL